MLIGVFSTAFLTRYLGLEYKGDFSYITQTVNIIALVLGLGFNQTYSFFYRKSGGNSLSTFINIYTFQFLVYSFFGGMLALLFNNTLYLYIFILFPAAVTSLQLEATMAVENIRLKIMLHMWNSTFKMFVYGALLLAKDIVGQNLLYPTLSTIFMNLITVGIYMRYTKCIPNLKKLDYSFMKESIKFSWLPMITGLLITLNYSADVIFLKHMGDPRELSLYATAAGIMNYAWMIPDAFKEVLVSRVARASDVKAINTAIKVSLMSIIIVVFGYMLFGKIFISILFGKEFLAVYKVTLILFLGVLSMVFYKIISVVLLAEGKRNFYFWTLFFSVLINLIANGLTIPTFGMYGAAWSSVLSYSICGFVFLLYYADLKKVKLKEIFLLRPDEVKMLFRKKKQ